MISGLDYTRIMASIFNDTTFDLELEKIKEKIIKLYNSMLEKAYRAENPTATPEEIEQFLEENGLDFKETEEDFSDEVDSLLEALDSLEQTEDLDPVSEKSYSKPEVEKGSELVNKTHETGEVPETKNLMEPKGLMKTPKDLHKIAKTSKVKDPTGTQKRSKTHERPNVTGMAPLVKQIQDTLVDLRQRQMIGRKYMEDRL